MAVLTAAYDAKRKDGEIIAYKIDVTKIYKGALVCENSSGYAVNGADAANYTFLWVAYETVDNSTGSAGDLNIRVYKTGTFVIPKEGGGALQTDIGLAMYVEDNHSVNPTGESTNSVLAGYVVEVPDSSNLRIRIDRAVQ